MNKRRMVTDRMPPDVLENWINGLSVAEQRTIRAARSARLLEEGPGGIMEQSMTTESENRILIEAVRIAAEQIEKLKSGPGGIMELKQTIADKEAELEEDLVLEDIGSELSEDEYDYSDDDKTK